MKKNNAHYKDAMNSIKDNNVSDAIDELKLCLKFNSKSVSALNLLGLAYYLKCRFDKAEKTWRKSLTLQRDNNKARDYLELITKQDFKEIRKEYKHILFNDEANRTEKIRFLKRLIEEYDELIEPYVILGLLYKKDENYEEALEYFYQAYDLDSGNQNIKNYIMQCEKEDKNSNAFNFKSQTNKKSALIAGIIAVFLFAAFLNVSGLSPFEWIENNIRGFEFAQTESEESSSEQNASSNTNNEAAAVKSENPETEAENTNNFSGTSSDNNADQNSKQQNSGQNFLNQTNLLQYQNNQFLLSLESIQELKQREEEKQELAEANTFLEEGTEQQLFNLGMDYFSQQDYQDAADIFKSIYNLTETDYLRRESLFLLARSYEQMDNYQSADHFYRIYLNEYNDTNYYDEALYNLGLMLNEAGEVEKSREILERLRREDPYSEYNNSQVYEILNQ
ncbi:TolA-binding protein [Halanaerobium saccharolyticum]|uniref:TolA-binding protein n=1 Tax=Halanaerobium saccharolyticum TaxID=43595 RepID=A0A4R7YLA6_9FIRM|nr:tetratricopeptide repeat protein [Halanaerobium saccharolyticum]RAK04928.1 TolA-binding protein [Halanaerobium saccharolyticum]TDV98300.1 TolA-binding protein [Halanaerobium saccharolyticum]TDX51238.1 TolA-binding protein [Halanaerobium saccharolyticum]